MGIHIDIIVGIISSKKKEKTVMPIYFIYTQATTEPYKY